jgi:hypothetical protein
MKRTKITIDDFKGGFAPCWYNDSYPSYGNRNMAADMRNVELANLSYLTQGPGLSDYPGFPGYDVLVKSISEKALVGGTVLAIANASAEDSSIIFNISSVTANSYAYEITAGASPIGQDVAVWGLSDGTIAGMYSWYNAASANVGIFTPDGYRDDDWLTVLGGGTITAGVPLPLEVAGNGKLYIGNGRRVSSIILTSGAYTWLGEALSLQIKTEIQDIKWCNDQLYVSANMPDVANDNITKGSVYIWDGVPTQYNREILVNGRVGALFVDNGTVYVFYRDLNNTGAGYKLGYISGQNVIDLCSFKGGLPQIGQVTKHNGFIKWVAGEYVWAFGSPDSRIPAMLYQCNDGGLGTVGALASPFGTLMVASYGGTGTYPYQLSKLGTTYETDSYWKSLMFPVGKCTIEKMIVYCEPLTSGARADFTLTCDNGNITNTTGLVLNETGISRKEFNIGQRIDNNFRIEISFANGSATYPVKINRIETILLIDNY